MEMMELGEYIAKRRREKGLSQIELAHRAAISRITLNALENHRVGELGFTRLSRILAALDLTMNPQPIATHRPTLDELREENRRDQGLD